MKNGGNGGVPRAETDSSRKKESWFLVEIGESEALLDSDPERALWEETRGPSLQGVPNPFRPREEKPRPIPRFDPVCSRRQALLIWGTAIAILLLALLSHFRALSPSESPPQPEKTGASATP